jgi:hypothetical protein
MADLISSSIVDGGTVEASQITALYDTFTGTTTYDNISIVGTASYSITASHALNGGGSSVDTGSLLTTASVSNDTITFTKGDTTTFDIEVNNVTSASYASTASFVTTAQTASFVTTAQTASFVTTAQTASFVTTAQTASYITGSNVVGVVSNASNADLIEGQTDPLGGTQAPAPLSLAVGSLQLSSGTGQSNPEPLLAGKTNGVDAFIAITAVTGTTTPGETYDAAIQPTGEIRVSDMGNGSSTATVAFTCWYLP